MHALYRIYKVLVELSSGLRPPNHCPIVWNGNINEESFRNLHRLDHTTRIADDRIPKKLLSGWLPQSWPAHRSKLKWRDKVRQHLKRFSMPCQGQECVEKCASRRTAEGAK